MGATQPSPSPPFRWGFPPGCSPRLQGVRGRGSFLWLFLQAYKTSCPRSKEPQAPCSVPAQPTRAPWGSPAPPPHPEPATVCASRGAGRQLPRRRCFGDGAKEGICCPPGEADCLQSGCYSKEHIPPSSGA